MKNKVTAIFLLFGLLYTAVIVKALYVQVLNRDKLIAYSESQIMRETKIYPKRGFILDRHENPLAINVRKYNIFTFVKNVKKLKKEIAELSKIVPKIKAKKILKKAASRKKFTWIARKIELEDSQVEKIRGFKDIFIETLSSRYYPNHELLSQVLGFVGIDNEGLAGIEYQYNNDLKGEALIYKYFKDAKGRPVKFESADFEKRATDITLSIDKDIQAALEEALKEGVVKHEALSGGAAVMDVTTGEIWAMANYPSFDPNKYRGNKFKKLAFATDPIEPGSVFKTLTIASALENNIVREDTNFFCERGKFRVGNHYIKESDNKHAYEWLSVSDILKYSSNIGTTKIAFDLTYPLLKKTLDDFKIGLKTGIETGESRGILDKNENITPLRLSNISFGQGVATTGIQMLAAYAAIVNGGTYVKPTLLKINKDEEIIGKKILSKKTTDSLTRMLVQAVEDGTGSRARVPHFTIAGKTSTAQRADARGGYSGYISGFVGYPVNVDRKFVIYVYVDNPKKGYYGNTVAAPIFQKIAKNILYKNKRYNNKIEIGKSKRHTIDKLNIKLASKRRVRRGIVPNLIGLDKGTAFKVLDSIKAKYSHKGFGIVTKQFPAPGTAISKTTVIKLRFKAPSYDG